MVVALVALFVVATSLRGIAGFYTDYLWFESLDLTQVWRGVLGAKSGLVALFSIAFFVIMWVNLLLAERLSGSIARFGGTNEDEFVLRYRELVGRRAGAVRAGVAAFLGLVAGSGASAQWQNWILFTNRVDFGEKDATFKTDVGFYVFQLPFLRYVAGWLFSSLVVVLIATLVAHYLNGGIQVQAARDRVGAHVKAHVSVLLAALAVVRAGQYWLDRYELVFSTRGAVQGATYTDVNVQLKAIYLLLMISFFAVALFIVNIWRRGWVLPVLAVGLWGFVAVLAGEAVPAFVQRARVEPSESAKEAPYIRNNIEATRKALGLDDVDDQRFAADGELNGDQLVDNAATVQNIRLWDTDEIRRTFQELQRQRQFYSIPDVDVDRYVVNGEVRQTLIATRNLNTSEVPQSSWEARQLTYTHGYGAVLAPANAKTGDGQPDLVLRDVPVRSDAGYPKIAQPSIYIGEEQTGYKIVNTKRREILVQDDSGRTKFDPYAGADGVPLDSIVRRAAFALRFGDVDPLISSSIRPDSKLLLQRDVRARVQSLAPFLAFDQDPYSVVLDGKIVYVVDAYTTSDRYPNAQRADTDDVPDESGLRGRNFNYARNSVKAVVDAYDGTVKMYVTNDDDPLIKAYRKAFPKLFTDQSEAPPELRAHFRFPEDLFRVLTTMWGRYHVDDPDQLLNANDEWNVAAEPGAEVDPTPSTSVTTTAGNDVTESGRSARTDPTYLLTRLPGEKDESFVMLRPFTPSSTQGGNNQLTAFMTAKPDGTLESFEMPPDALPNGPGVAARNMQVNEEVSSLRSLLGREGSRVSFGSVQLVPIEQSILYVRPMYVTASEGAELPLIKQVIVSFQQSPDENTVAIAPTLDLALQEIFNTSPGTLEATPEEEGATPPPGTEPNQSDPGPGTTEPGASTTTTPFAGTDDELVSRIKQTFDQADAALRRGDSEDWAAKVNQAQALVDQLADRRSGATGPSTTGPSTTEPSTTGPPTTQPPTGTTPSGSGPTTTAPRNRGSTTTTTRPGA